MDILGGGPVKKNTLFDDLLWCDDDENYDDSDDFDAEGDEDKNHYVDGSTSEDIGATGEEGHWRQRTRGQGWTIKLLLNIVIV